MEFLTEKESTQSKPCGPLPEVMVSAGRGCGSLRGLLSLPLYAVPAGTRAQCRELRRRTRCGRHQSGPSQAGNPAPPARLATPGYVAVGCPIGRSGFRAPIPALSQRESPSAPADRIYALGDDEVRVFEPGGTSSGVGRCREKSACLAVGADGRVYVGAPGRVEILRRRRQVARAALRPATDDKPADDHRDQGFPERDPGRRCRRPHHPPVRYEPGSSSASSETKNKTGNFMLPNRSLDFDVDAKGVIRATDTGRHQVTAWALDGSPLGSFGKFGMSDPADFVGCCNPVNLAVTPDGKIVTGEKMVARVKVYEPDGKLLAVIGPENFDPSCTHIHLAVDSKGRILAADPVRREIKIFSLVAGKPGQSRTGSVRSLASL